MLGGGILGVGRGGGVISGCGGSSLALHHHHYHHHTYTPPRQPSSPQSIHLTISFLQLLQLPPIQMLSPPLQPPEPQNNHQYPTTTTTIPPPRLEPQSSPPRINLIIAILKLSELQHLQQVSTLPRKYYNCL